MSHIDVQDLDDRPDLFDEATNRSQLDQLLANSRLYRWIKDYLGLLRFVVRLRDYAPFNGMLLQVRKPGLRYAASARDWMERFGRQPREGARALLILWPFGPVALVCAVADIEGREIAEDAFCFPTTGSVSPARLRSFEDRLFRKNIVFLRVDGGDGWAGYMRVPARGATEKNVTLYGIWINRNHGLAVHFTSLAPGT